MKNKNPLYVVKGKEVEEASSIFDLVIKKFNLGPAFNILKSIFYLLLEQVENYAWFSAIVKFYNDMVQRIRDLARSVGVLQG
jgi:hypothetical protein